MQVIIIFVINELYNLKWMFDGCCTFYVDFPCTVKVLHEETLGQLFPIQRYKLRILEVYV